MNKQQIKYIATLFNLDATNPYILEDIETELQDIGFENFRNFYQKNSNYIGSEFKKGLDKFLFFTKLYRKFNTNVEKKLDYCKKLASKVKAVSSLVLEHNADFYDFKIAGTDDCFFEEKDIKTLEKIGSLLYCARLQRSVSGTDALLDKMEQMISENIQNKIVLTNKFKPINTKVLDLMKGGKNA